jgi:hypothetical protein
MRKFLLAGVLVLAGTAVQAADGVYVGAGIGKSDLNNVFGDGFNLDSNGVSWKALVGFRPIDFFAVEANYLDLGHQTKDFGPGVQTADAKAFGAYAVGILPLPYLDFFGKVGAARWKLDGSISGGGQFFAFDNRGTQFAYGSGIQANWGAFSARFEYDGFQIRNTDGLAMYSVDAIWTFL